MGKNREILPPDAVVIEDSVEEVLPPDAEKYTDPNEIQGDNIVERALNYGSEVIEPVTQGAATLSLDELKNTALMQAVKTAKGKETYDIPEFLSRSFYGTKAPTGEEISTEAGVPSTPINVSRIVPAYNVASMISDELGEKFKTEVPLNQVTGTAIDMVNPVSAMPQAVSKFANLLKKSDSMIKSGGLLKKPIGLGLKAVRNKIGKYHEDYTINAIKFNAKTKNVKNLNANKMTEALSEYDIAQYLDNPKAMKEALRGRSDLLIEDIGDGQLGYSFSGKIKDRGILGEINNSINNIIHKSSGLTKPTTKFEIKDAFKRTLINEMDKTDSILPRVKVGNREVSVEQAEKWFDSILGNKINNDISLQELHKLKKDVNKRLTNTKAYANDTAGSISKAKDKILSRSITNLIEEKLKGVKINGLDTDASEYYKTMNNRFHNLIKLSDAMEDPKIQNTSSMLEKAFGITKSTLGAYAFGMNPAAAIYFGFGLGGKGQKINDSALGARMTHAMLNPNSTAIQSPELLRAMGVATQSGRAVRNTDYMLDSMEAPYIFPQDDREALMEETISTPLPRDTQSMLQTPELLRNKLQLQAPEFLDAFDHVNKFQPEMMDQLVSTMIQSRPDMFEQDPMGRINGIVPEQNRMTVSMELWKDKSISPADRIRKMNELNKTGRLV